MSKTLEVPFKTPEFAPDGIATIWQAMRDKAVQMATFHNEEANLIKAGAITDLTRLRSEIKTHLTDLDKEVVQTSKKVDKQMEKFVFAFTPRNCPINCRVIKPKHWGNGFQSRK